MDADPLVYCPECGKPELKKLLSAPNFRLKGGGWYETDFKKDNKRNLAGDTPAAAKKDPPAPAADKAAGGKSGSAGGKTD